ncbi:hypothetical protein [Taibaiella soli]|uniref:Sugar 3,4-ketoisomerase QdtA cupin domain-containing protein n=1 Tax=Taibaiella soli TaxID=1649169 RepID=A0A2W2BX16_9BACT|nr:hypothetical protein [Taibaiella soli]PZF72403.1 hypothetical protein DN068_13700 [Taibaiella soli]
MTFKPLQTTGHDERGFTAEYYHPRLGQHLIIFRKAGTVSGRHYHKGLSINKNPEILILLSGHCIANWREANGTVKHTKVVIGPTMMEIPAFEWHEIIAETDCTFLELNSLAEHAADTYRTD